MWNKKVTKRKFRVKWEEYTYAVYDAPGGAIEDIVTVRELVPANKKPYTPLDTIVWDDDLSF